MRALVTGVAGFIGSHIAERLVADGHEVHGVDCFTDYYDRSFKDSNLAKLRSSDAFEFREGDLNELDAGELLDGVEWVFHQAAQAGVRASWGQSFTIYTRLNIDATQRLLEAAKGHPTLRKFVYASSSSVYGSVARLPMKEDHPTQPLSPYGVTKLAAEHLAVLYHANHGVPTASLRYFTVYGPRQRPDMAFHRFLRSALLGEAIHIYGDGSQTRDFTFVEDAVQANLLAAQHAPGGAVYNIGGGSRVSVNEVLDMIRGITERELDVRYEESQKGDMKDTVADAGWAAESMGYRPAVSLEEGLRREWAWVNERYGEVTMPRSRPIVAIDGPAASGKSTLAKAIARRFDLVHVDTGAMYRAVALRASRAGVGPGDDAALERLLDELHLRFEGASGAGRRLVENGEDLSEAIRDPAISELASRYSANPVVRAAMVRLQREMGVDGGLVLDGRDIGSVVFPDAEVKVFLDADVHARADRRARELVQRGLAEDPEETRRAMLERDRQDRSRTRSPLTVPDGAVVLDSTHLDPEALLARVASLVEATRHDP